MADRERQSVFAADSHRRFSPNWTHVLSESSPLPLRGRQWKKGSEAYQGPSADESVRADAAPQKRGFEARLSRRFAQQDIMCPYGSKNNRILVEMKGKAVLLGDGAFPSILDPLNFLNPQRWMEHIGEKQRQLFVECLPDFMGQGLVLLFKPIAETVPFYLPNHSKPSSVV
jgi:hypothetical protein